MAPQSLSLQMHPMVHALPPPWTIPYNISTLHITSHHIKHLIIKYIRDAYILYAVPMADNALPRQYLTVLLLGPTPLASRTLLSGPTLWVPWK